MSSIVVWLKLDRSSDVVNLPRSENLLKYGRGSWDSDHSGDQYLKNEECWEADADTLHLESVAMVLFTIQAAQCIDIENSPTTEACQLETDQVEVEHRGRLLVFVVDSTAASMGAPLLHSV